MKLLTSVGYLTEPPKSWRSCICGAFPAATLCLALLFIGRAFLATHSDNSYLGFTIPDVLRNIKADNCQNKCSPQGSEALPSGIVTKTSNLESRLLWGLPKAAESSKSLFSMPVGIKQKLLVNEMVKKFLESDFVIMLFHYDGIVDKWKMFEWSDHVIHVSVASQTKWWFAKRFLHPDIVSEYEYVFLWDEDLGVDNFDPKRYLSIVKKEGLEISQPALDPIKSEVHHQITVRGRRSAVHRRIYKPGGPGKGCNHNSTNPPCTGWIEVMAPVFSKAAWRCTWHMIQGDRTKKIRVVDAEYVIHHGLPTLGGAHTQNKTNIAEALNYNTRNNSSNAPAPAPDQSQAKDPRTEVRWQSHVEEEMFKERWRNAAQNDQCWVDPYPDSRFTLG